MTFSAFLCATQSDHSSAWVKTYMFTYAICAFLAPALASAAAFPWAIPEPTLAIPAIDSWSPAPTPPPRVGAIELFRRADDTVCGWISGSSASPLTCYNSEYGCATNTYYGVHGCCPPDTRGLSACSIPTTCIPSSMMSASCDDKCSSNSYIAKCTGTEAPECYVWQYIYATPKKTTLTEYGCAASATTAIVQRTYDGYGGSSTQKSDVQQTQTATGGSAPTSASGSASPTPTSLPATQPSSKSNMGAIIGGAVGGVVGVSAIAFGIIFLIVRDRRHKREAAAHQSWLSTQNGPIPGVTEYKPHSYDPTGYDQNGFIVGAGSPWQEREAKGWPGQTSPEVTDCGPVPGGSATLFGVVETAGTPVHQLPA